MKSLTQVSNQDASILEGTGNTATASLDLNVLFHKIRDLNSILFLKLCKKHFLCIPQSLKFVIINGLILVTLP